jgi:hypothetical protein
VRAGLLVISISHDSSLLVVVQAFEDEVVAVASLRAADGDVLQPPTQQLVEREGEAHPLEPRVPLEQRVVAVVGELPDFADRDNGRAVFGDGLRWLEAVAIGASRLLQLLFAHHHTVGPLQNLRRPIFAGVVLLLLLLLLEHHFGHVGGDKLGVLSIGKGTFP